MNLKLYSIFDKVIGEFSPPVCQVSDAAATRDFENALVAPGNPYVNHPSDYTLMFIGTLDTKIGEIIPCEPTPICRPSDFVYLLPDFIQRKEGENDESN